MKAPQDFKPGQVWKCPGRTVYPYLINEVDHENFRVVASWLIEDRSTFSATGKIEYYSMFNEDIYVRDLTSLELELL